MAQREEPAGTRAEHARFIVRAHERGRDLSEGVSRGELATGAFRRDFQKESLGGTGLGRAIKELLGGTALGYAITEGRIHAPRSCARRCHLQSARSKFDQK